MGYRIDYQPIQQLHGSHVIRGHSVVLTGLFLFLFGIMTYHFWPEGKQMLQRMLIPGDPAVTVPAVETLLDSLSHGENTSAALEAFCLSILRGASFASY